VVPLLVATLALSAPAPRFRVEVHKAKRELLVYSDATVVHRYRIGLGTSPVGSKVKAGDHKTPEGSYFVCLKNPESQFHLSLGLSYPNQADADRGLADHLVSKRERDEIVDAVRHHRCPPWNTKLGGEIFIHGRGSASDWTWGCVALDDADVDVLYRELSIGTPVEITP